MFENTRLASKAKFFAVSILAGLLVACGGGGGGDGCTDIDPARNPDLPSCTSSTTEQTTIPDGLFVGTTSSGRTATGLVLDDGSYYVIYSAQNNPAIIAGAAQGNGTALNGSFSSTNGKDINLEGLGLLSGNVSASYVAKQSFNGSVTYPSLNQTVTFTGTYDSQYELTPSFAIIAGSYTGRAGTPFGTESASLTVSATGVVAGIGSSGCTFSGSAAPRAKGNVYTVSTTFGGFPCLLPNTTLTGAAYFDATTKRLYAVGLTADRDSGVIYAGTKL